MIHVGDLPAVKIQLERDIATAKESRATDQVVGEVAGVPILTPFNVSDLPPVRALVEQAGKAELQGAEQPVEIRRCSEILRAMESGLRTSARLWRANGDCSVRMEGQCTGDKEACPFRR